MTTALLEKQALVTEIPARPRAWPVLGQPPKGRRVPLFLWKGRKTGLKKGTTYRLLNNPPATIWPSVMKGIEDFGLYNLYLYAPKEAFVTPDPKDPAIIAERDGKYYLIAAWE